MPQPHTPRLPPSPLLLCHLLTPRVPEPPDQAPAHLSHWPRLDQSAKAGPGPRALCHSTWTLQVPTTAAPTTDFCPGVGPRDVQAELTEHTLHPGCFPAQPESHATTSTPCIREVTATKRQGHRTEPSPHLHPPRPAQYRPKWQPAAGPRLLPGARRGFVLSWFIRSATTGTGHSGEEGGSPTWGGFRGRGHLGSPEVPPGEAGAVRRGASADQKPQAGHGRASSGSVNTDQTSQAKGSPWDSVVKDLEIDLSSDAPSSPRWRWHFEHVACFSWNLSFHC